MVNQELILFVRAELTKGKTQENIRAELLSGGGWSADDIDQVFGIVNPATPPPTVSPQAIMPVQPFEAMPVHKLIEQKPKSSFWKVFTIVLLIVLIGTAVWGFYFFRNSALDGLPKTDNTTATPEQQLQLKDLNAETPIIINDSLNDSNSYEVPTGPFIDTKDYIPPAPLLKNTGVSSIVNLTIRNFAFSTENLTVKKGTTVIWTNNDSVGHTVTGDTPSGPKSETMSDGQNYSFTFNQIGKFDYHCTPHPNMKGSVIVVE